MSSTKPVIDGFKSYGYEMIYLYIAQKTIGTLQNGRAVEHWNPETGDINTTNVNFPWAASCMAGSIWEELTDTEKNEYIEMFQSNRYKSLNY
jgi:ABC-type transporter MlaC component